MKIQSITPKIKYLILAALTTIFSLYPVTTYAENFFALSPMYQLITLTPGEKYEGNFLITNPADAKTDFYYKLHIEPFSEDNNKEISLTPVANGDYNQMIDWIRLSQTHGSIAPNETAEIRFTIDVPKDVAAGGQYASIVVASDPSSVSNTNIDLQEVYQSAHLIYAEVAGKTIRKGETKDAYVPKFLFSGNIYGSASVTNEGNVHSYASHILQVFPLFSNEESYTNEEKPKTTLVMPGNTNYSKVEWENTPKVGIFHVVYNVSYEGVKNTTDQIVVVCPIWLLLIVAVVIVTVILLVLFAILFGGKKKNNKAVDAKQS